MLLHQENWRLGYHQIISDCRGGESGGTVLILCNPDADALCAARILSYALRADKIPYQLRPCGGFKRLLQILQKLNLNDGHVGGGVTEDGYGYGYVDQEQEEEEDYATIRAVVLLNLGATRNLQKYLFQPTFRSKQNEPDSEDDDDEENSNSMKTMTAPLLNQNQTKLYVLDSHRPYHLANVHADRNIILWNDYNHWHDNDGGVPSDGDGLSEDSEEDESDSDSDEDESSDDDDDDDSEGEAEFEDGDDFASNKGDHHSIDNDDGENDEEDDGDVSGSVELGKRSSPPATDPGSPSSDRIKRKRSDPSTPSMEDSDHSNDVDDDGNEGNQRRQQGDEIGDDASSNTDEIGQVGALTNRQVHEDRRDRIRRYYNSGTFFSSPVAFMAYTLLADQLRHETVGDLLWLACIGVTDAFIHNRLDLSGYIKLAMDLQEKIEKVYPDLNGEDRIRERMANTMYAEDLYGGGGTAGSTSEDYNGPMTQVTFSDNGRVLSQRDEFRFFLLRHTSLWDAMVLSPDLNTKMELWRSSGIRTLQEMLAKMGLPLSQCQQPYAFMKPNLKRRLKLMMMEHEEEYGLENLKYTAFVRVTGYKSLLSASDMSLAVTALLECDSYKSENVIEHSNEGTYPALSEEEEEEQTLLSSFNVAYDALNSNASSSSAFGSICASEVGGGGATEGTDLSTIVNGGDVTSTTGLGAGVRLAISVQRTIIATAVNLVERKAINRLSHFRYAYLHATSQGVNGAKRFQGAGRRDDHSRDAQKNQHHIFAKPLALTKLAHFLMDMHRSNNKWTGTRALPLVLLAEKPQSHTYLVIGFEYPEMKGSIKNNKFGKKFEMAAKTIDGIHFKFDSFDSNVVEIGSDDVSRFVEQLHYMIDSI